MSMPNIPDIKPDISVSRQEAINVILSSIGMEELSLAHMLNAEAEKVQYALGTLESCRSQPQPIHTIIEVNKTSGKVLKDIIKNQIILLMKFEDVIDMIKEEENPPYPPPCPPPYPYPPYPPPYPPYPPPCPPPKPSPCPQPCPPPPPDMPDCPPIPPVSRADDQNGYDYSCYYCRRDCNK